MEEEVQMDDYDILRKKFRIACPYEYNVYFGINIDKDIPNELQTRSINEATQDFRRVLIDTGIISCTKILRNQVKIILSNKINDVRINPLSLLKKGYRYFYKVSVPLCLYLYKKDIENKISDVMRDTRCVIRLCISDTVQIIINGPEEDCLNSRVRIIEFLESLMGRESVVTEGYFPISELVNLGYRVFYSSKINSKKVFISGKIEDVRNLKQVEDIRRSYIKSNYILDTLKLNHLIYYEKNLLEDILCSTDCYLEIEDGFFDVTNVSIVGFIPEKIVKCRKKIERVFHGIAKALIACCSATFVTQKIFIFEDVSKIYTKESTNKRFLAVGSKKDLKDFLSEINADCEIEIELDPDLEEFMCGKKNGKINKIIKDTECEILIRRKFEDEIRKIVIFVSGNSINATFAIESLENEFPAELAFYLNEKHHKRIIGFGGKNIQRIMKKHGVYIKFMSENERALLGLKGNVIIKTPKKNSASLEKMKEEVLYLADEKKIENLYTKVKMDLFDFYDFSFYKYKILFDHASVYGNFSNNVIYYKSNIDQIKALAKERAVVIRFNKGEHLFIKSLDYFPGEQIDTKDWYDSQGVFSFKAFNSVLLYSYESLFPTEKQDTDEEINFSERLPKHDNIGTIFSVGFQKNDKNQRMP
ncbi:KH domain-containing protein [Hamiltosporidium tvaerminnensis]|uniref:KH domain-containing protein n=1 Tax=Hamiltosporidium tvaerminnensis TaxID=1176355 RepID=A0A4Q9LWN2_9MICR|nr:KH domain-containing protein [Hamiltosporidium tvaerminnensis]